MVSVLVTDSHAMICRCVQRVLLGDPRLKIVGEACDFSEAIAKARAVKPDVLILDPYMPFEPNLSLRELSAQIHSCGSAILGICFAKDDDARALAASMGAAELLDKMEMVNECFPRSCGWRRGAGHLPCGGRC